MRTRIHNVQGLNRALWSVKVERVASMSPEKAEYCLQRDRMRKVNERWGA